MVMGRVGEVVAEFLHLFSRGDPCPERSKGELKGGPRGEKQQGLWGNGWHEQFEVFRMRPMNLERVASGTSSPRNHGGLE